MNRFLFSLGMVATLTLAFVGRLRADEKAHKQVRQSTVWIAASHSSGSGALVDAKRRLVVTAAHVIKGHNRVLVFAPVDNDELVQLPDRPATSKWRESYLDDPARHQREGRATIGRVVAYDAVKDLAILQLDADLQSLVPIKLATALPKERDGLHIVGNPGGRPLFNYSCGITRTVGPIDVRFKEGGECHFEGIRFSSECWFGNSGGPVTNEAGELVGVVSCKRNATGTAVALPEIRRLLESIRADVKQLQPRSPFRP